MGGFFAFSLCFGYYDVLCFSVNHVNYTFQAPSAFQHKATEKKEFFKSRKELLELKGYLQRNLKSTLEGRLDYKQNELAQWPNLKKKFWGRTLKKARKLLRRWDEEFLNRTVYSWSYLNNLLKNVFSQLFTSHVWIQEEFLRGINFYIPNKFQRLIFVGTLVQMDSNTLR